MKRLLVALFILIDLAACGYNPQITTGVVIDKSYYPAHYETVCEIHATNGTCTLYGQEYVPDKWTVTIQDCRIDGHKGCYSDWYTVPQNVYDSASIGEQWTVPTELL